MAVLLELPPQIEAQLQSKARQAQVPTEQYAAELLEQALAAQQNAAVAEMNRFLDESAVTSRIDMSPFELEAALDEALAAVRPKRVWANK